MKGGLCTGFYIMERCASVSLKSFHFSKDYWLTYLDILKNFSIVY